MSVGLERLEARTPPRVDPEAIEAQLAALWREAGESVDGKQAVTRACLWNVVAVVDADGDEDLRAAVQRLPLHLASRTLILRVAEADGDAPLLEGGVSANCILAEGGGKLVCSEEVTLTARGEGQDHLPSLVRALLVPGVPTALVFAGTPDPASGLHRALLKLADRLVSDVDRSPRGQPLEDLQLALHGTRLYGMDLGWLRRAGLREGVASLFDPPATPADIAAIRQVSIAAPASARWTARLTLGWVASALGCAVDASGLARRGDTEIALALETSDAGLTVALDAEGRDGARTVACDQRTRVMDGATPGLDRPEATFPLEAQLARALATRTEDGAFRTALAIARELKA